MELLLPIIPAVDEIFTIDPPPAEIILGSTIFVPRNTPFAFTLIIESHFAPSVSKIVPDLYMPAFCTNIVGRPKILTVLFTSSIQLDSFVTSRYVKIALPNFYWVSRSICLPFTESISAITTAAPSEANV